VKNFLACFAALKENVYTCFKTPGISQPTNTLAWKKFWGLPLTPAVVPPTFHISTEGESPSLSPTLGRRSGKLSLSHNIPLLLNRG